MYENNPSCQTHQREELRGLPEWERSADEKFRVSIKQSAKKSKRNILFTVWMSFLDFLFFFKLHIYMNILFCSTGKPCHHNKQGFSIFYHLSLSSKIKPILSLPDFEWVMQAFTSTLLDYSKAFHADISPSSNGRLQTVLNVATYILRQQDSGTRYHHPGFLAPLASRLFQNFFQFEIFIICPLINKRLGPSLHLGPLVCLYTLKVPEAHWSAASGRFLKSS